MNMNRLASFPRPYPDPELFEHTLQNGFKKFPERKENYLKYRASVRGEVLDYLPIRLDVENVSRCNYRCIMCQVSDWPKLKRADDMSFKDYRVLLDTQYGLIEIKLQGMGEPLLGKCLFRMIEYARRRYIWVRSTTNGSLLHIKDNYKRLIDADICELQVSIDGVTPKTYKKIRRSGNLKKVLDNCILLNRYCRNVGRRRTRMWVVVQRENFNEVEQFSALAVKLGFERLTFCLDLNDWGQKRWRDVNDQIDMHRQVDISWANHLIELGRKLNLEVTFWFLDEKYDTKDINKLCPWPFERAYISSDMQIVPCCMISNPQIVTLGDAKDLSNEWKNIRYQEFRKKHITGKLPHYCRTCYE